MSAISLKSITGITSITTPAGVDNVFTVHTNDTTERFRVDSAGSLNIAGISTFSEGIFIPDDKKLSIGNASGNNGDLQLFHTNNNSYVRDFGTGSLLIQGSGVYIQNSNGGTNIASFLENTGVSIPLDLDVDGHTNLDNVSIAGVTTSVGNITIQNTYPSLFLIDTDHNDDFSIQNQNGVFAVRDETNNQNRLTINSGGEVLIGTETGTGNNLTIQDAGTSTTAGGNIVARFQSNGSGRDASIQLSDNVAHSALISMVSSNFAINLSGNERLRITSGGKVGINDTTPDATLSVGGATAFIDVGAAGGNRGKIGYTSNDLYFGTSSGSGQFIFKNNVNSDGNPQASGNERLRIDSSGKLIIGHTAAINKFHGPYGTTNRNPRIQINGTTVTQASMSLTSWDNNVASYYGPAIFLAKSGSSTIGTNARVSNLNSVLGSIIFSGDDGTDFVKGAMIQAAVDTSTGDNDMPGRLMFLTTPDAAQEPTEKLRIDSSGYLSFAGDTDTYIHHPQANQLAITVAGGSFPIVRFGTGGSNSTVGLSTDTTLVTNSERMAVRGVSSFKSTSNVYAPIYTHNEGNTSNTYNAHLLWNAGGANRGGIGYMPNTGEVVINNQNALNFATGATHLGGTTRLRIDSSGNIKIGGHSFNRDMGGLSVQRLHIEGTDGGSSAIGIFNNQNSGGSAGLYLGKSRGTSVGSDTIVQDNDPLGTIVWVGADGNDAISQGATIQAKVDGTPGSNDMPTRLEFGTTADGNATTTTRMTVHEDGMLSLRQHGNAKTYFFSSGQSGGYSSLTIVIDAHAFHSFVISVSHGGYGGIWGTAKYMGYENGTMYNANEGTETTDSNSRNITHSQNPGGGHKHRIQITGGMGTHPGCELRISIMGPDAYIDSRDITFTWS